MLDLLRTLWHDHKASLLCLLLGIIAGWFLSWHGSELPTLSRKQEKATRAAVVANTETAYQDTARAACADSSAAKAYTRGQAATRTARQYHRFTHLAHAPLPATPAAAVTDSLQRLLTAY